MSKRLYFPELDGLRFLAFLLVFIHHNSLLRVYPDFAFLHHYGWIGVDLFLALSAFLLTKLLVSEHAQTGSIQIRKFYIRRIFRIWPVYFVFLFGCLLYFCTLYPGGEFTARNIVRWVGLLTFTDNLATSLNGYVPVPFCQHLWTISYEEQVYLIIPFFILWMLRSPTSRRRNVMLVLLALFFGARALSIELALDHPFVWVLPFTHFESVLLGTALGLGLLDRLIERIPPLLCLLGGIGCFAVVCSLPNVEHVSHALHLTYTFTGLSVFLVLLAVQRLAWLRACLSAPLLVYLGKRSYGLYLYHLLGNHLADVFVKHVTLFPSGLWSEFVVSLLLTIGISVASYRWIESPFLKLKSRYEIVASRPV